MTWLFRPMDQIALILSWIQNVVISRFVYNGCHSQSMRILNLTIRRSTSNPMTEIYVLNILSHMGTKKRNTCADRNELEFPWKNTIALLYNAFNARKKFVEIFLLNIIAAIPYAQKNVCRKQTKAKMAAIESYRIRLFYFPSISA